MKRDMDLMRELLLKLCRSDCSGREQEHVYHRFTTSKSSNASQHIS
jgi:hypothetical protein